MSTIDDPGDEQDLAVREEQQAAAEAAQIGGQNPPQSTREEALRPVYEAGGGEQDGFELAEQDLVRNASHDSGVALPERDRFTAEREADQVGVEYAEPDEAGSEDA